jgi:hypothetical protein
LGEAPVFPQLGSWSFLDSITKQELGNEGNRWIYFIVASRRWLPLFPQLGSWSFLDSITKLELGNEGDMDSITK